MIKKLVTIFLLMAQSGPTYAIKQLPIMVAPEMSCHTALAKKTIKHDTGIYYRGKQVFAYYCKNSLTGKFIP